jgi:peptidoglycan hydrolase-like protein with peptidoglycan-binding domain
MKKSIRKDVTCDNCGWSWDIEPDDKHPYLCHQCGHENTKGETDEGAGPYDAPAYQMEPDHVHFKHQYNEQNDNKGYLLQMGRKSIIVEQYGDEAELFKLASAYYRKNGKVMTIKVLEKILHTLSKRDEAHRAKSQEFPPSLHLQEQKGANEKVRAIQKRLISKGYNLGKTGADGFWGALTDKAWKTWKSKKTTSKETSKPLNKIKSQTEPAYRLSQDNFDSVRNQRDTFDPYAQQNLNQKRMGEMRAQNFAKGIVPVKKDSGIKPHFRIFSDFLSLRKSPITTNDFTSEELKTILTIIKNSKVGTQPKNVNFSADIDWSKVKSGEASQLNPNMKNAIAYTLGNSQVQDMGKYYKLTDIYDFNNYYTHPENYTLNQLPYTLATAFKKVFSKNYVQGIEELASYYHKLGYKGIPVSLDIPKNLT